MKKKILIVAKVLKGHIMPFHLPTIEMLHSFGCEVHVCARNDYDKEMTSKDIPYCDKYYNLPFDRNPFKADNLFALKKLNQIIADNDYDIIHCHTPIGATLARIAAFLKAKSHTKVIYTAHGFHFFKGAPLLYWLVYFPVEWLLSSVTDAIITINKEDYATAQKYLLSKYVEYIPGVGINIEKFSSDTNINIKEKRKELDIPAEAKLLLSIGELNKNKNHEIVIRSLAKMKNLNIHYAICGDGPLKNYLQKLANDLGISQQVHLLGYRYDIPVILKIADALVHPSWREGLPVTLLESMASKIPCIVSNVRGNKDLVKNNIGGYYFRPDSEEDLIKIITKLDENKNLSSFMADYNKELVYNYELPVVLYLIASVYFKLWSEN